MSARLFAAALLLLVSTAACLPADDLPVANLLRRCDGRGQRNNG